MNIFVDADGCPVVNIVLQQCKQHRISCTLVCDTSHQLQTDSAEIITVDKGADSADFVIANKVKQGDLVITQDYGLASMCLTRGCRVLHHDGWEYTQENIDALLFQRHESRKHRSSGLRTKGPKKRDPSQNQVFLQALQTIFQGY